MNVHFKTIIDVEMVAMKQKTNEEFHHHNRSKNPVDWYPFGTQFLNTCELSHF
jgi:hypothetical protein